MKFRTKSVAAASAATTELLAEERSSLNRRISKSFKRSESFRASSRLVSKIRARTNLRRIRETSSGARSDRENSERDREAEEIIRPREAEMRADLRGIVRDVEKKLSIGSSTDWLRIKSRDSRSRGKRRAARDRARASSRSIDESHSYENPTFDSSLDKSIAACLYADELEDTGDDGREIRGNGETETRRETTSVVVVVGNDGTFGEPGRIDETTRRTETKERTSDRARNNDGTGDEVYSASKKSHASQAMEFLEGLGKKRQPRGSNDPPINANPLAAGASLVDAHLAALFSAVEDGGPDEARAILESTGLDVNSVNGDGLSVLDAAVLLDNAPLAKMLLTLGARESDRFASPECLAAHLTSLSSTAVRRLEELGDTDNEERRFWERRVGTLRKMLLGFDRIRPPDPPSSVAVDVTSPTSIAIKWREPEENASPIRTKIKVEWSTSEDFGSVCGEKIVADTGQLECRIDRLVRARRYSLRVAAGNLKGWSAFARPTPARVATSGWRDLEGGQARYADRLDQLETLFSSMSRPEYGSGETAAATERRDRKKKGTGIKQLFSATSKFQKSLRRGIFLACLLYHEDKILVTNEDFLPVIQVDETYSPSSVHNDFHWFVKVSCAWDDVKSLRREMERCEGGGSSNHLRLRLLRAASQMQTALCLGDLGQVYHRPLRDAHGTLVVSIVNAVKNPKSVSIVNARWMPLDKAMRKMGSQENAGNVAEVLTASLPSQMSYHRASGVRLGRGLYLGYLKMHSSLDLVRVLVSSKTPNVLPHCKIRDNPHVSAEEWDYLKRITRRSTSADTARSRIAEDQEGRESEGTDAALVSAQQRLFVELVAATARRLLSRVNVHYRESLHHRLYDSEVIELTNNASLIVIVPPAEVACSAPGTREILHQRGGDDNDDDFISLPVQVFEMLHLSTYHKRMTSLYSRLSCILEVDTAQAQQNYREAFSSSELEAAKDKLAKLRDLERRTNDAWKGARWLIDLIAFARDRTTACVPMMRNLLDVDKITDNATNNNDDDDDNKNNNGGSGASSSGDTPVCTDDRSNGHGNDRNISKSNDNRIIVGGGCNGVNGGNGHGLKRSLLQLPPRDPKLVKSSPGRGSWPVPHFSSSSGCSSSSASSFFSSSYRSSSSSSSSSLSACSRAVPSASTTNPLSAGPNKIEQQLPNDGVAGQYTRIKSSVSATKEDALSLTMYKHSPRNRSVFAKSFVAADQRAENTEASNGLDDYDCVNESLGHVKPRSARATASVAAVAAPPPPPPPPTPSSPSNSESQSASKKDDAIVMPAPLPGILQVYAAYETGLASGTSLKLHVTPRTTAREVVDLVVKQLNMAVVLKGQEGPIYTSDEWINFCLVAVIGARERCLRDDFKPLQLQNPWKKGRLYVRQKQDVLAALEHSSKHTAYL